MTAKALRGLYVLACAALALGACRHGRLRVGPADDGEVVEAEGWSPHAADDLIGTKRRSLAEAQKKAVEKVVGVYISAKTRVAESVTVDQNILANVDGYIRKYEVLKEWQEEGFYKTRIRALVRYKKVGEDLKALGLIRPPPPPGNPKVLVRLSAPGGGPEERAAVAVRRALLDRGFLVLKEDAPAGGGAALEDAKRLKADLAVRGSGVAHRLTGVELGGFHSFRARVALEALKPETGELLAGRAEEASMMDAAPEIAEAKSLELAGQLAAERLAAELAELMRASVKVGLRVSGLAGLPEVQRLAESLRLQPEIGLVTLSDYRRGVAELAVTGDGVAGEELAALLVRMKRHKIVVRSVSPYLVEVESQEP